ncbi:MAG: glycoside hydrolase domain-containing protein [bacterium]
MLIILPLINTIIAYASSDDMPFQLWSTDALIKIFPDTPPERSDIIEVKCAHNEYQSAQFAITAQKQLKEVKIEIESLIHESGYEFPKENITWNFIGYIPLKQNTYHTPDYELVRKAPAYFPDPLIEDRNITIDPGRTQPVWINIYVPEDIPSGKYDGNIIVKTSDGEKSIKLLLNVYSFSLPKERHLCVTLWFDPHVIAKFHNAEWGSEKYWKVLEKYAKNMAEHRQNVIETPFPSPIRLRNDGTLDIDYTSMDRWIEFFEKAGACERIEFPAIAHTIQEEGHDWWTSSQLVISDLTVMDSETDETIKLPPEKGMALMLADLDRHLQEKGWQDKAMIHISDEPTIYKVESYCKVTDFIHKHAPHLKIIEAIETTGFGKCLDVWVPKLSHLANWYDEYDAQRKLGTEMWFYTCCHPYGGFMNRFIDFPLIETRLLFWLNWKYRLDGYLHWGLNRWTDKPFEDVGEELPPGDRYIIYPGTDGPINSIRWEASREGLQDYEYFRILAEKTKEVKKKLGNVADFIDENQRSDEVCRSIINSFTKYETDPEKLRMARETLAKEITEIDQSPLVLLKTTPQAETEVVSGPILILIRGIAEEGSTMKMQGGKIVTNTDGTFFGHAFVWEGSPNVIIEIEKGGKKKQIVRHFKVRPNKE